MRYHFLHLRLGASQEKKNGNKQGWKHRYRSREVEQLASREGSHNAVEKFIHSEATLGHISDDDALFFPESLRVPVGRRRCLFSSDGRGVNVAKKRRHAKNGTDG